MTEPRPDRPAETFVIVGPAGPKEALRFCAAAYGLSGREKEVPDLVVRAYSTSRISEALDISESTVQGHLSHAFEKVGIRSWRDLLKRLFFDNLSSDPPN